MYKLIIFDLDGTLTDSKEGIINCVKYALESFGITENDEKKLYKFIGPPLYDSFMGIYGFSHIDAVTAVEKYRERYTDIGILENSIYPDAVKSLELLKRHNKTLALATSKPLVFAKRIIAHFGISDFLNYVVGAELDGSFGYKDEVIQAVLRLAKGINLSETVMIGDRENDITGAKKCGISSIGLRSGYAAKNELENAGADFIFENLSEAAKFILSE